MIDLTQLAMQESDRQRSTLNFIASENYPSPAVLKLLGSAWSLKYAEGYPGKRYYAGNIFADELESNVGRLALQVFDVTSEYGVNAQVLSGSPANAIVFMTALDPGDTIMSLQLSDGGHLSHLHPTSAYLKFFRHATYAVKASEQGYEVDEQDFRRQLAATRPQLVIIGFSAYPRSYVFSPLIKAAHEAGALVLADIAHINGLIAVGLHDSPFKPGTLGADFVTMTTHKTMRGPRGALVFAKQEWMERLNRTVFPGTSGGPHLHQMAAIGQSLQEILGDAKYPDNQVFGDYVRNVLATAKELEVGLKIGGLKSVSNTQTHLVLVRLPENVDSLGLQKQLEKVGIITNRNQIPGDSKSPWRPSGLRLGTAALTSRGLTTSMARTLGIMIGEFATQTRHITELDVDKFVSQLSWPYDFMNH